MLLHLDDFISTVLSLSHGPITFERYLKRQEKCQLEKIIIIDFWILVYHIWYGSLQSFMHILEAWKRGYRLSKMVYFRTSSWRLKKVLQIFRNWVSIASPGCCQLTRRFVARTGSRGEQDDIKTRTVIDKGKKKTTKSKWNSLSGASTVFPPLAMPCR